MGEFLVESAEWKVESAEWKVRRPTRFPKPSRSCCS